LKFLDPDGLFQKPKRGQKFDCVIATDCASFERLGKAGQCIGDRKFSSTLTITKATRATPTSTGFPRANLPAAS
jgi:hypothetical protein